MQFSLQSTVRGLEVKERRGVSARRERAESVLAFPYDGGASRGDLTIASQSRELTAFREKHAEKNEERCREEAVSQPCLAIGLGRDEGADSARYPNRKRKTDGQADERCLPVIVADTPGPDRQTGHAEQKDPWIPAGTRERINTIAY